MQPNSWFNQLPVYAGEKPLSAYTINAIPDDARKNSQIIPFPNGVGKIYQCTSAQMLGSDFGIIDGTIPPPKGSASSMHGADGFFSYAMNIDLKKCTSTINYTYPAMPKLNYIPLLARTVFMFDIVFSPTTEGDVNGSPAFNSVNPAGRWLSFASRHTKGGNINFLDGHVGYYKLAVVQAGGTPSGTSTPLDYPGTPLIWNPPYRSLKL